MRITRLGLATIICAILLTGCRNVFTLDMDRPLTPYQHCLKLKRELIFYSNDPNHNTQWSTPTKRASILQEYRENDCTEVLHNTTSHFWE